MKKTEDIKKLLSSGNGILKDLHDSCGFDFEKPIGIIPIVGNFTAKNLTQIVSHYGFDLDACKCIVLLHEVFGYGNRCRTNYFKAVSFEKTYRNGNSPWGFNTELWNRHSSYARSLNIFGTKTSFETSRKNNDIAFAIVQNYAYLTKHRRTEENNYLARVKLLKINRGLVSGEISSLRVVNEAGEEFNYYTPYYFTTKNVKDLLDGSGYLVLAHREALKERATALKEKRSHEAASAVDCGEKISDIDALVKARKLMLIEKLKAANTSEELRDVCYKLDRYIDTIEYYVDEFKSRSKDKSFNSVAQIENGYATIVSRLSE